MTRLAVFAAALAMAPGVAVAQPDGPLSPNGVGPEPWSLVAASSAFAADDAFLFDDVSLSGELEPGALAVAERIDRDRLGQDADIAPETGSGRVADAFGGFVRYGRDGLAYATLDLARAAVDPSRFAQGPSVGPSRLALNSAYGR